MPSFTNVAERVIAATYASMQEMVVALAEYTKLFEMAGEPSRQERGKAFAEVANKFATQFRTTKIFLPRSTAEMIDKIFHEIRDVHIDFMFGVDSVEGKGDIKIWKEVYRKVEALVKVAVVELEDNLRKLLGDDAPDTSTSST